MGITLLGLASQPMTNDPNTKWYQQNANNGDQLLHMESNYIGVDQSALTVNYAKGIAYRWNISANIDFAVDSAENFLHQVTKTYPGSVHRILIQFPTPYQLPQSNSTFDRQGNARLPRSAFNGFVATQNMLRLAAILLTNSNDKLHLQSNCEDVAV
jgi:hypothetical protein